MFGGRLGICIFSLPSLMTWTIVLTQCTFSLQNTIYALVVISIGFVAIFIHRLIVWIRSLRLVISSLLQGFIVCSCSMGVLTAARRLLKRPAAVAGMGPSGTVTKTPASIEQTRWGPPERKKSFLDEVDSIEAAVFSKNRQPMRATLMTTTMKRVQRRTNGSETNASLTKQKKKDCRITFNK